MYFLSLYYLLRGSMAKISKTKLIIIISLTIGYMFLTFLPFEEWIGNEYGYLAFKFVYLFILACISIFLKKKYEIEIERPIKEISYLWLLPLLIPCFSNFLYVFLMKIKPVAEIENGILVLDLLCDLFLSVVEDTILVDMLNSLFLDLFEGKMRRAKLLSMTLCGLIFTLVHTYSFIYKAPEVAAFELIYIFLVTLECSYLAIYFDSEIIPITFHFLFNAIDFVAFDAIFEVKMSWHYFAFSMLIASFSLFYILALTKISSLQKYRKLYYKEDNDK